jgi:hypothetical protein
MPPRHRRRSVAGGSDADSDSTECDDIVTDDIRAKKVIRRKRRRKKKRKRRSASEGTDIETNMEQVTYHRVGQARIATELMDTKSTSITNMSPDNCSDYDQYDPPELSSVPEYNSDNTSTDSECDDHVVQQEDDELPWDLPIDSLVEAFAFNDNISDHHCAHVSVSSATSVIWPSIAAHLLPMLAG